MHTRVTVCAPRCALMLRFAAMAQCMVYPIRMAGATLTCGVVVRVISERRWCWMINESSCFRFSVFWFGGSSMIMKRDSNRGQKPFNLPIIWDLAQQAGSSRQGLRRMKTPTSIAVVLLAVAPCGAFVPAMIGRRRAVHGELAQQQMRAHVQRKQQTAAAAAAVV